MYIDPRDLHAVEVEQLNIDGRKLISSGVKSGHYVYFLKQGTLRITSHTGDQYLRPGRIAWIGGGVERTIWTSTPAQWIVLRIRNRLFASSNGVDRIAWRTLMKAGRLSRLHPRLSSTHAVQRCLFEQAESLLEAASGPVAASLPRLKGHVLQCLGLLDSDPQFGKACASLPVSEPELDRLQRVLELIEEEAASITDATALAARCGMSRSSLYRLFTTAGLPAPGLLLHRARLELAVRLLKESDQTILSIAMETGFGSLSAFYRVFERVYGRAPGSFRG